MNTYRPPMICPSCYAVNEFIPVSKHTLLMRKLFYIRNNSKGEYPEKCSSCGESLTTSPDINEIRVMINPIPPLPSWVTKPYDMEEYYIIDIKAAVAAGETLPIELWKIRQFDEFFTNPPTKRGTIDFK